MKNNYGGAYDINPYDYWSRDDLISLKEAIEDTKPEFKITAIYLKEGDSFDIEYTDKYNNEWSLESDIKIDLRRADTPAALKKVYAPIIIDTINSEIEEHYKGMDLSDLA